MPFSDQKKKKKSLNTNILINQITFCLISTYLIVPLALLGWLLENQFSQTNKNDFYLFRRELE